MNMLFVSALLLVRNESKEFTIASTRMRCMYATRTDKRFYFGAFFVFYYYNIFHIFCPICKYEKWMSIYIKTSLAISRFSLFFYDIVSYII